MPDFMFIGVKVPELKKEGAQCEGHQKAPSGKG